jgi:TRAP-type mannitol/chloroaromatic compound transport system substrate-binding protein
MKRRQFLQAAGLSLTTAAVGKPAIAQTNPAIKWRLTSSFPKSLDTLYWASETIAKYVAEATDNQFQIQPFAAGEIVPALQAMDAVTSGTVEACHTGAYYYFGKEPALAFFSARCRSA